MSPRLPRGVRQRAVERAGGCCEHGLLPRDVHPGPFEVDHVIPRAKGGTDASANLAFSCPRCNLSKWTYTDGIDPETGVPVALFNPRSDVWAEHFRWNPRQPWILEGRTHIGRATVSRLDMNNRRSQRLRECLFLLGLHP